MSVVCVMTSGPLHEVYYICLLHSSLSVILVIEPEISSRQTGPERFLWPDSSPGTFLTLPSGLLSQLGR